MTQSPLRKAFGWTNPAPGEPGEENTPPREQPLAPTDSIAGRSLVIVISIMTFLAALAAGRTGCIPILNRPGLESLFNLGAAVADPKFAHAKQAFEMQEASRLTMLMGDTGDVGLDEELERQLRDHEQVVRADGAVTGNEKFGTFQIADKAGMVSLYRTDYFACSQMTHANTGELGWDRSADEVADDVRVTVFVHWAAGDLVNGLYCKSKIFGEKLAKLRATL